MCRLKFSKKQVQIKELKNKGGSKRKARSYFILLNKSFKKKRGKPQAKQKNNKFVVKPWFKCTADSSVCKKA